MDPITGIVIGEVFKLATRLFDQHADKLSSSQVFEIKRELDRVEARTEAMRANVKGAVRDWREEYANWLERPGGN